VPTFSNPVLAGGHPDPTICRVGEDFYLVTSCTFGPTFVATCTPSPPPGSSLSARPTTYSLRS
jgi:hypothetical protein